jgi:subfamily B ATP-binding cassette protein HlyB/CyaB
LSRYEFLTNASLTVLVDPVFTLVFLAAMYTYSVKLFLITIITIPAYFAIAIALTGPLRARVNEKYERGSANNALLVESVGGIQTVQGGGRRAAMAGSMGAPTRGLFACQPACP